MEVERVVTQQKLAAKLNIDIFAMMMEVLVLKHLYYGIIIPFLDILSFLIIIVVQMK